MAYKYITRKQKKSYLGWKIFIGLSLTVGLLGKVYLWSQNSSYTQEYDRIVNNTKTLAANKVNEANEIAKEKTRNIFSSLLGIDNKKEEKIKINEVNINNDFNNQDLVNDSKTETTSFTSEITHQMNFKYDHKGAPSDFTEEQILTLINSATNLWKNSCGFNFNYDGKINSDFIPSDGAEKIVVTINGKEKIIGDSRNNVGVVRWNESLRDGVLGQATLGVDGPAKNFILDLNPNLANSDDLLQLKFTIIHELGHVLGLPHNRHSSSIMHSHLYDKQTGENLQSLSKEDADFCITNKASWDNFRKNDDLKVSSIKNK